MLRLVSLRGLVALGLFFAPVLVATTAEAGPTKAPSDPAKGDAKGDAAKDAAKDKARTLAQDGIKAFEAGNPQQAIELLQQAEALFHAPVHGLFMARAHAAMGKLVEAKKLYHQVAEEQLDPSAPPAWLTARDAAKKELDSADRRVPKIVLTVSPESAADLVVTMNDVPLPSPAVGTLEVNPGQYTFKATSKSGDAVSTVEAKERSSVDVRLVLGALAPTAGGKVADAAPKRAPSPTMKAVGLGAIGLGGAAVVAGAVVGGLGAKKRGDANKAFDACEAKYGKRQCQGPEEANVKSLDKSATTMGNAGIGLIAGGAAVAATGVVLLLVSNGGVTNGSAPPARSGRAAKSFAWAPVLSPSFIGVDGTF